MRWVAQHRGVVYKHFADIKGAEKCFHVLATLLGGGVVVILQVEGVCVSSQHRMWLPEYNRNYKKDQYCGSQTHRMLPRIDHVGNTKPQPRLCITCGGGAGGGMSYSCSAR